MARQAKEELGINVFAFSCEGYKGVSQSAGHHIANNGVFKHIVGIDDTADTAPFRVNLLGEYDIGGDSFEIEELFARSGISLTATLSGNVNYGQITRCHTADLNCVMCHRSINYMAEMMEKKYGIPWIKVKLIGADSTAKSLRKIAQSRRCGADRAGRDGHRTGAGRAEGGQGGGRRPVAPARPQPCSSAVPAPTTTRISSTTSA